MDHSSHGASVRDRSGLAFRVARTLHGRWRRLRPAERDRLEPLAHDLQERALDLRGAEDREAADQGLQQASEKLAGAMVNSAEADPECSREDVARLRDDLSLELSRLASADIQAGRTPVQAPSGTAFPGASG